MSAHTVLMSYRDVQARLEEDALEGGVGVRDLDDKKLPKRKKRKGRVNGWMGVPWVHDCAGGWTNARRDGQRD